MALTYHYNCTTNDEENEAEFPLSVSSLRLGIVGLLGVEGGFCGVLPAAPRYSHPSPYHNCHVLSSLNRQVQGLQLLFRLQSVVFNHRMYYYFK